MSLKIGVIGCGNMASSVVKVMANQSTFDFLTYTPSFKRAESLAKEIKGTAVEALDQLAHCDMFLLGMKPQQLNDFKQAAGSLLLGKPLVSMLTAISVENLASLFETDQVMRIMPNTPSKIGRGIVLMTASQNFTYKSEWQTSLENCGEVYWVEEKDLDDLTVFAGSGPAYVFQFAQSLLEEMLERGYSKDLSDKLIRQLFSGASELMKQEKKQIKELIDQVTSSGGVTIEAVRIYQDKRLSELNTQAINAALARNRELKQALNSLK